MGIIDKAKTAIAAQDKKAADEAAARQSAWDYRRQNENRRAVAYLKELELPRALKSTIDGGKISITYKKKLVVEIEFGHDTSAVYEHAEYQGESEPYETAYARYMADWLPKGAEQYKKQTKGHRDTFYPKHEEDQAELGEFLLRVMDGEFVFE